MDTLSMVHANRTLWLIPARQGSIGVPNKNIRLLGGHPLLAYRISAALTLAPPADVWLSTDSEKYAQIGKSYGVTIPFLRPDDLARGETPSSAVVLHAMAHAGRVGREFDFIGLLEPTSPFVSPSTLSRALASLEQDPQATAVVATRVVRPSTLFVQPAAKYLDKLAERLKCVGITRRQQEAEEITPSGGFYISRWKSFLETETFYNEKTIASGVGEYESLEIDEEIDFLWAEFLIASGRWKPSLFGLPDFL